MTIRPFSENNKELVENRLNAEVRMNNTDENYLNVEDAADTL